MMFKVGDWVRVQDSDKESMKPKRCGSCDGCKNLIVYSMQISCKLYEQEEITCVRQHNWLDRYEPKETL